MEHASAPTLEPMLASAPTLESERTSALTPEPEQSPFAPSFDPEPDSTPYARLRSELVNPGWVDQPSAPPSEPSAPPLVGVEHNVEIHPLAGDTLDQQYYTEDTGTEKTVYWKPIVINGVKN